MIRWPWLLLPLIGVACTTGEPEFGEGHAVVRLLARPGVVVPGETVTLGRRVISGARQRRSTMEEQDETALQDDLEPLNEQRESNDNTPAQLFEQMSHIAITLSYDLVDKLRYWEKETLEMSDEEIEKRLGHMAVFLERLKKAYVDFAETDL